MSVGWTTTSCGQYILDHEDQVGAMDGSARALGYTEYTVGSLVGPTFIQYKDA